MSCTALILGLHLATAHVRTDLNDANPGVYARCDAYVAGVYHNSVRRTTAYVGYTYPVGPVDIMLGVATGYSTALRPVFVPSVKLGAVRVHLLLPSSSTAKGGVHVSIEREW